MSGETNLALVLKHVLSLFSLLSLHDGDQGISLLHYRYDFQQQHSNCWRHMTVWDQHGRLVLERITIQMCTGLLKIEALDNVHCNAGTASGNTTVVTGATSLYDVSMSDLAHVLLPELTPAKTPKFEERTPKWLAKKRALWLEQQLKQAYCGLNPAGCDPKPLQQVADAVAIRGHSQQLQASPVKQTQPVTCHLCAALRYELCSHSFLS